MPRLSVLMPGHRCPATTERAVRSVLRDLPHDGELLVADDGSASTALGALSDRRLRLFPARERSASRTMAAMLSSSDSEFVARMDADAVVLPGRFRRQLRALQEADAVFTTARARGADAPSPSFPLAVTPRAFPFHLLLSLPFAPSTMAARRSAIEAVGGYHATREADTDLRLRLAGGGARLRALAVPVVRHPASGRPAEAPGPEVEASHDAFASLSARLLGAPQQPFAALLSAPLPTSEKLARFGEFDRRFRSAVAPLPIIERRLLGHLLEQRAEWLWERSTRSPLGDAPQSARPAQRERQRTPLSEKTGIGALT